MPKLVFVDIETTGLEEKDRICEIAAMFDENSEVKSLSSLCKSGKKIGNEAMSLHHITNEMVKESPSCKESSAYTALEENNSSENVLIAHNLGFTLGMLEKEGFKSQMQCVDTFRCTKALIPECEVFNLQFLRYELQLYKEEKIAAEELGIKISVHRALSDAFHIRLLYGLLLEYATLSELIEISSKPILIQKFSFGKYSGRYIEEIAQIDRGYLEWMAHNFDGIDEDLLYSIKTYLES